MLLVTCWILCLLAYRPLDISLRPISYASTKLIFTGHHINAKVIVSVNRAVVCVKVTLLVKTLVLRHAADVRLHFGGLFFLQIGNPHSSLRISW
jgi:hypothetical protein